MNTCQYQTVVPTKGQFDVIIVGGGPSGFCAAAAAAREGAKTALVERYASLGGMATAGLVAPISSFRMNGELINQGIPWEFVKNLETMGAAETDAPNGSVAFEPEAYKLTAQRMVLDAGVTPYLLTEFVDCIRQGNMLQGVVCKGIDGLFVLEGKQMVDCTGNAEAADAMGMPMLPAPEDDELQPASLCFRLGGVNTDQLPNIRFHKPHTRYANQSVKELLNQLAETEDVPQFGGPWFLTSLLDGVVFVNMTRSPVHPSDTRLASRMECSLREDVFRLVALLKKHVEAFRNCYILQTAMQAGYRETRRIQGLHVLTGEELQSGAAFPDTIAQSAHPVDIHVAANNGQHVQFLEQAGNIPFRCCVAADFPNLSVAGRCISADRTAFASLRVQAPVMAIGAGVGKAAALCALQNLPINTVSPAPAPGERG